MQVNANSERLQKSHSELLELQLVLERAGSFFTDAQSRASTSTLRSGGNDGEQLAQTQAYYFCGKLDVYSSAVRACIQLSFVIGLGSKKLQNFQRVTERQLGIKQSLLEYPWRAGGRSVLCSGTLQGTGGHLPGLRVQ